MTSQKNFLFCSNQFYIGIINGLIISLFLTGIFRFNFQIPTDPLSFINPKSNSSLQLNLDEQIKNIRVICWVMTNPKNIPIRAIHINRTWAKRCTKTIFISSEPDEILNSVVIPNVTESRDWLWAKTKAAFQYVWENHRDEADWFVKADDDTFLIVENLKKFLRSYSPADPIFFGCQFNDGNKKWISGGAGYILSKEALKRFLEDALTNSTKCSEDHNGAEDAEMAKCLLNVGVTLEDSRDIFGRHRFLPFVPADHVFPRSVSQKEKEEYWYWRILHYPQVQGMDCCANDVISFHYVSPRDMYVLEYFLYHVRPHGVINEQKYIQEYPLEFTNPPPPTTTTPGPTTSATNTT